MLKGASRGVALSCALVLFLLWVSAQGAELRVGVGVCWGLTPISFSFVGGAGRGQLISEWASVLLEGMVLRDLRADDWVLYLDGALVFHIENSYLGTGLGWARWEDTAGKDQGVWTQTYLKLLAGYNWVFFSLPIYVQVNFTFGEWYWLQPAVTVGIWLGST